MSITEIKSLDARGMGDALPIETFDVGMDLTGHTIHLVIQGPDGEIAILGALDGVSGSGLSAVSSVSYTPTTEAIALAAGTYRCS